jgi:hypothetical protein
MRRILMRGGIMLTMAVAWSGTLAANETGIANIHAWVKLGRRTCFADHYHYGSGTGPTQAHAQVAAIRSWIWPTDLEYGSSWANYRLAAAKVMKCARHRVLWTCDTQAIPCRGY